MKKFLFYKTQKKEILMKTIRCRNCGISYQATATICLRCMSPLEKTEDKTENDNNKSTVSFYQEKFISDETKNVNSDLKTQTGSGKLVQHASPIPNINKKAIEDAFNSQTELPPTQTETIITNTKSEKEASLEIKSNNKEDNYQSTLKQLEKNLQIHEVNENDIFSKNGYLTTDGFISHLNLSNVKIEEIPPGIYKLKSLKFLNLSGTMITEILPDISELQNLAEINLHSSAVQSLPKSLLLLSNLKKLNVFSTAITPDNAILGQLRNYGVNIVI